MGPKPTGVFMIPGENNAAYCGEKLRIGDMVYTGRDGKYYRVWSARSGVKIYNVPNSLDAFFRAIGRALGVE